MRRRPLRHAERGQALISALFALLLVSLALGLVALAADAAMRAVRHELRGLQLTALTDAAVAEALGRLANNPGFTGQPDHPFGGGTLGSEVTAEGLRRWRIRARAHHGGLTRTVEVEVERTGSEIVVSGWSRR